jgi:hypothetical protein
MQFLCILLDDFNVPGYDWGNGFPQANSHYYIKITGHLIHSAACYLGLSQYNIIIQDKNPLYIPFANFSYVNTTISNFSLAVPEVLQPSLIINLSRKFLSSYS